jgi:hypothetical protein
MTSDQIAHQTLEDVLDAFVASSPESESVALSTWVSRYPEYERELTEFAASWSLMRWLPPAPDAERTDEETLVLRGMSVVQNLLHRQQKAPVARALVVPFESLLAEGRACGLGPVELARAAGLGVTTLRKLDRRLIRFATIPAQAIDALAAAIQRATGSVTAYLQQRPIFAAAAAHRAEEGPQLVEQEDFFEAVRLDPTMTPEQRAPWLAIEDRDAG